jgi:hypothetical protein
MWNGGLLSFDFFRDEGFIGEPFIFLDVSVSVNVSLGGVTFPFLCLSSPPSSYYLSTSSPPPPLGESGVVSFDVFLILVPLPYFSSCCYWVHHILHE